MNGPVWLDPINDLDFVKKLYEFLRFQITLNKYWILFFFEEYMEYAPSKHMGKILISLLRTFKKSRLDFNTSKSNSLFSGLNYSFAKKKALNRFKT